MNIGTGRFSQGLVIWAWILGNWAVETGNWILDSALDWDSVNGLAGCWSGSEQNFGFNLHGREQDRTDLNRPGGSGALFFSLYPVYSRYNSRGYVRTQYATVRTNDGTHSFFLVPVPVQVPVQQVPRRPWSPRPWLPPSLNTDPHLFRPCWLFFRQAPVVPSFSTPISPPFHPTHLPTSSRPQRPPTCPIILFLYCSLTRHRSSFS